MSEKAKKYVVVYYKSSKSTYRKYCKMSKKCFDAFRSKSQKFMKHDPIIREHVQMSLARAK